MNNEQKLVGILTDKNIFKAILSNKQLLSDVYNNKNFEPFPSVLEEFRDQIFETYLSSLINYFFILLIYYNKLSIIHL